MAVVAFVRPEFRAAEPPCVAQDTVRGEPESRLRLYGRAMRLCFVAVLAAWGMLQLGCVLSLFLHFQSGIVAGIIDGTLAFKFWPAVGDLSPTHGLSSAFVPHSFPLWVAAGYTIILAVAAIPFCASLLHLTRLFSLYAQGEIFTDQNAVAMRQTGHAVMATGYSPLLLGPLAHAIGVLKPVTGITGAMLAFIVLGFMLLAISHVMDIGQRLQRDQEAIL